MKKLFFISLVMLIVGATACSKDKQYTNSLIKKEGKWLISSHSYKQVIDGVTQTDLSVVNSGYIEFEDEGEGEQNEGGTTREFTWNITDQKLFITYNSGLIQYNVKKNSKNEFAFDRDDNYTSNGSAYQVKESYVLTRTN